MADKVGTKINKKTQAGRDVYETPEGEMVSEKSTTFKYKGQWINIPSIHEGNRYDDDTLILMLEAGLIEPTSVHKNRKEAEQAARKRSDSLKFNQGGTPMLEQQMELFEDGGLRDEGGEVDEVSGNEVPIGGTKEGVRDDVPALVSKGEFVFPEDVTRYIGLDKLMQMRQEAKMGLKRMDAMGQMGNGDEATMPDDMPFGMADLIVVAGDSGEELEMAEGGFVTRSTTATRTQPQQQPTYTQPPVERPPEFRSTRALTPTIERPARSNISFRDLMADAILEFKEYRNEDGQSLLIAFVGGKPVYPIPTGYTLYNPEAVGEEPSEETETAEETNEIIKRATSDKKDAGDLPKSEFQLAGSWDGASLDLVYKEGSKFVGGAADLASGAVGVLAGPIAPVVYLFTKLEKRKYESKLDGYIARAKEEGRQDLVEKFTAHKKALAEGGQGLIGKAINAVSKIFSSEEVETEIERVANEVNAEPAAVNRVESTLISDAVSQRIGSELSSILGDPAVSKKDKDMAVLLSTQNLATIDASGRFGNLVEEAKALTGQDFDAQKLLPPTVFTPPSYATMSVGEAGRGAPTTQAPVPDPSGPAAAEATFGAPLSDKTPPPVDELVFTPTPQQLQTDFDTLVTPDGAVTKDEVEQSLPQTYTSTGAQMQASQKALEDIVPPFPDPSTVPVLEPYEPAPITTGRGYDTSLGQDTSSYAVTPEQVAYSTSVSKGQEDPYDPRGIMPISEQVTRAQPVTTQAQTEAPSMDMPDAFIDPLPLARKSTAEKPFLPITTTPPLVLEDVRDDVRQDRIKQPPFLPQTTIEDAEAAIDTRLANSAGYAGDVTAAEEAYLLNKNAVDLPIDVLLPPTPDPRGREQLPSVEQKLSSLRPTESAAPDVSLRPKARPTVTEETTKTVTTPTKKVAKKPAPKPAPVSNEKSTRLDSTNPKTSANKTKHLSKKEKESLKANPSLEAHYTATANRRANEAAKGDTSNTDAAKEKDNKIVCTAMNNSYGFGSYRQAIWLSYSKDYLTKEHELGYHTLFLPLVDLAYNKDNKFVRTALEHIARHRTADLRASMQNKKRNTLGRVYRCILEPLVYTVGKFRIITGI
tara:strand:- start:2595 stop:5882 length:3288 start_codon:yes stop_codon:yes gene_type:complete